MLSTDFLVGLDVGREGAKHPEFRYTVVVFKKQRRCDVLYLYGKGSCMVVV